MSKPTKKEALARRREELLKKARDLDLEIEQTEKAELARWKSVAAGMLAQFYPSSVSDIERCLKAHLASDAELGQPADAVPETVGGEAAVSDSAAPESASDVAAAPGNDEVVAEKKLGFWGGK